MTGVAEQPNVYVANFPEFVEGRDAHPWLRRMRERVASTEEPDPVTQDLMITVTADLEKHHWMFQAENVSV